MSERIQTQLIRDIPPQDIAESEEKFYLFLTGWLRTPSLYTDKHGHPKLRKRYLPYSIGIEEGVQWLYCMAQASSTLFRIKSVVWENDAINCSANTKSRSILDKACAIQ